MGKKAASTAPSLREAGSRVRTIGGHNAAVIPSQWSTPCRLDREADALLMLGYADRAERLAHQAAALRAGAP